MVCPRGRDAGHVAFFWDVFVRRELDAVPFLLDGAERLDDSFDVAHEERWGLPLPDRAATMDYFDAVTEAVIARLDGSERSAMETYLYEGFRNFFTPERDDVVAGLRTCAS